jgi:tetratricopeptide (TPR) repeat protein
MAIKSAYCTALLPISRQTRASRCKTFLLDSSSSSRNETARTLVGQGMQAFRDGHIAQSIALFDQVESLAPARAPFLWQRGISYYYDNRFDEASKQFRLDAQVNPNDTEEIVWDIASQLKSGRSFPVENQMSLHRQDPRRIMVSLLIMCDTHHVLQWLECLYDLAV